MKALCNCVFIAIFLLTDVIDQTNAAWVGSTYDSNSDGHKPFGPQNVGEHGDGEPVYGYYYDPKTGTHGRLQIQQGPYGGGGQLYA
ncbi:unnamed protein product [Rodentolepis nana]|uniref:Secreted protein n=1 Tax=Rodentolepis nana TaxID=102285 RepID=A0A0R3T599_RODNA|nr:unnamed protein product [Rodentolepis nana]